MNGIEGVPSDLFDRIALGLDRRSLLRLGSANRALHACSSTFDSKYFFTVFGEFVRCHANWGVEEGTLGIIEDAVRTCPAGQCVLLSSPEGGDEDVELTERTVVTLGPGAADRRIYPADGVSLAGLHLDCDGFTGGLYGFAFNAPFTAHFMNGGRTLFERCTFNADDIDEALDEMFVDEGGRFTLSDVTFQTVGDDGELWSAEVALWRSDVEGATETLRGNPK